MARLKFIDPLTEELRQQLREIHRTHPNPKNRRRTHAILLSRQGYRIGQLQDNVGADWDTISI